MRLSNSYNAATTPMVLEGRVGGGRYPKPGETLRSDREAFAVAERSHSLDGDPKPATWEAERRATLERLCACRALHSRLYRRTRNRDEAEDLAQEVYLRMLRIAHPNRVRNWSAYTFVVAENLFNREIASRARRERGRIDVEDPAIQNELADSCAVEDTFDAERYSRRLDEVVQELSSKCRAVVLLRRDGLSYRQIGLLVGISTNMVKKYLKQARLHCTRLGP